jgi:type II secretory pathway pseudopilin PulG
MPIRFTCPHCGNTTDVAEQYAGQSGPCARCNKTITVPPAGIAPLMYDQFPPKKPRSTSNTILIILAVSVPVVLFCGGILVALLLPAIQAAREAARRAQCSNNLRQIGFAMQQYRDKNGHYPPAYVADKNGKPMHSWRVLLLPYLGEQALYDQYDMNQPWDSPHNMALANRIPDVYRCPSDSTSSNSITCYAMLVGRNAFSDGPKGRKVQEFPDGLSSTIAVAENCGANIVWLEPRDLDADKMSFDFNAAGGEISSGHPAVVNVLFGDGRVQSLSKATDPDSAKGMSTIDGAEQVTPEEEFMVE